MKIGAIIQARMGSTRLPGKVMLDLCGKYVIDHVIDRVKQSKYIDEIVIASTTSKNDDKIIERAKENKIKYFRGSEEDVLSRYYYAALENKLDVIVRITSDCPLIDSFVTDEIIKFYIDNKYEIVSNEGPHPTEKTYPRGLDTEVFSFKSLKDAYVNAKEKYQREHVTPYIYENYTNIYYYKNGEDYSNYRWTLDTHEDWKLIKEIYINLYKGKHDFHFKDILNLFDRKTELMTINQHVNQKKIK
ncbi:glycosyltransferase family protein [Lutibacter sp. B2]|nr:glycosyltransferase family protein [Lutibacter sp. B2]